MDKKRVYNAIDFEDIPASEFEFVHTGEKIYDSNIEAEARGFFKDALFRLCKNKASVAAFFVICIIVFMAIAGPFMTPYSFREQHPEHLNLPPRVKALESICHFPSLRA